MNTRPLSAKESANLATLNGAGCDSVLLFVTATGLNKAILDATDPMRQMLKASGVHDFQVQGKGQPCKVINDGRILTDDAVIPARVSLYRPVTKSGDPRMWFQDFKGFVDPDNVCAVFVRNASIYVLNLTTSSVAELVTAQPQAFISKFLASIRTGIKTIATELLEKLRSVASAGPLRAVCAGDTAIGRSIEEALGIQINSKRLPDYKGIEIKSGRSGIVGRQNRATLFACVPDWKLSKLQSSGAILDRFGYARDSNFKLYCTVSARVSNSQGLQFSVEEAAALLREFYSREPMEEVCVWRLDRLHAYLLDKHRETFWVKAKSIKNGSRESFQLESVTYTSRPSISQFDRLLIDGTVTMDHLIKRTPAGGAQEKGPLFKVARPRLPELFLGAPKTYSLV